MAWLCVGTNFIKCTEIHKKGKKNIHLYEYIQAAYAGDRRYWNRNPCRKICPGFFLKRGFTGYNGREENRSTGIGLYLCGKIMKKAGSRNQDRVGAWKRDEGISFELGRKKMDLY